MTFYNATVQKLRSIQKWFVEISVQELDWTVQSLPNICPTSVPDLTNALVAEWKQVPIAMFQYQVESLHRSVETVIAENRGIYILIPRILEWDVRQAGVHMPLVMNCIFLYIFLYIFFLKTFSPQFCGIQLIVTVLSRRCNSHTDSGEAKVESCESSKTQPNQVAQLLDTMST